MSDGAESPGWFARLARWELLSWGCALGLLGPGALGVLTSFALGEVSGGPILFDEADTQQDRDVVVAGGRTGE